MFFLPLISLPLLKLNTVKDKEYIPFLLASPCRCSKYALHTYLQVIWRYEIRITKQFCQGFFTWPLSVISQSLRPKLGQNDDQKEKCKLKLHASVLSSREITPDTSS